MRTISAKAVPGDVSDFVPYHARGIKRIRDRDEPGMAWAN